MEFKHGSIDSLQRIFVCDCLGRLSNYYQPVYEADETTYYLLQADGSICKRKVDVRDRLMMRLIDPDIFGIVEMANKLLKFIIDDYINEGLEKKMNKYNFNLIQDRNIVCSTSLKKQIESNRVFGIDDIEDNVCMILPDPEFFGCFGSVSSDDQKDMDRLYCLFGSRGLSTEAVQVLKVE
jgi:hypothetical protein